MNCTFRSTLVLAMLTSLVTTAAGAPAPAEYIKPDAEAAYAVAPGILAQVVAKADLVVSVDTVTEAVGGNDIEVTVTVTNRGTVQADGTSEDSSANAYIIDLVWSLDSNIPAALAVQPVYQGLTEEDFVEDMLVLGGRISNTQSIAPGASVTYTIPAYVPRNMEPGTYWLGAFVDSAQRVDEASENNNISVAQVTVGTPLDTPIIPPADSGHYVMAWAVGNTPLYAIDTDGFTDYRDRLSLRMMVDAPFGGHLGFRQGYDNALPTPQLAYYRWSYRRADDGDWTDLSEKIGVHYERTEGGEITFPVYWLGPNSIGGRHLYQFRPHAVPISEPGVTVAWPETDWFGDIYSARVRSAQLPAGEYLFKLEVYDEDGVQVMPGPTTFRFLEPTSTDADGTVHTALAPSAAVIDGGYTFTLHIDNRSTMAVIDPPTIGGGTVTDGCGFLPYDPLASPDSDTGQVEFVFHAIHPANHAVFTYRLALGGAPPLVGLEGDVTIPAVDGFSGNGAGSFTGSRTFIDLLGGCERGAFSQVLWVLAKATTGWHQRINAYDRTAVRAFALAPE